MITAIPTWNFRFL